jgi:outer membrane protein TolC
VGTTAASSLDFTGGAFDTKFYPRLIKRSSLSLTVTFPLWNNGQREIQLSQARVNRDVSRAIRADLERSAWHDVAAAYDAYETSRATRAAACGGRSPGEQPRPETRYRAGATTILNPRRAEPAGVGGAGWCRRSTTPGAPARAWGHPRRRSAPIRMP